MIAFVLPLLLAAANPPLAAAPAPAAAPAVTRKCLMNRGMRGQRLSREAGYFVQNGEGWWRNTGPACALFGPQRVVVSVTPNDRQCSGELINIVDSYQRVNLGACTLGEWQKVDPATVPPPFNH